MANSTPVAGIVCLQIENILLKKIKIFGSFKVIENGHLVNYKLTVLQHMLVLLNVACYFYKLEEELNTI